MSSSTRSQKHPIYESQCPKLPRSNSRAFRRPCSRKLQARSKSSTRKRGKRFQQLHKKRESFKYELDTINGVINLISSDRNLKEQLQRAKDDSGNEDNKSQIVRDIEQRLSLHHKRMEEKRKGGPGLGEGEPELQSKLSQLQAEMAADMKQIDLVLFFDALDEFDGHLDKLSGFLKSLKSG